MSLIIDNRECKLIKILQTKKIEFTIKQLDITDIQILDKENQIRIIIERKTINDLLCSLKDGRYKEQKLRVKSTLQNNQSYQKTQFLYLIEGSLNQEKDDIKKTIYGTYISLCLRDNIKIIKTDNLDETSNFLIRLLNRINTKDDLSKEINNQIDTNIETQTNTQTEYLESIKSKKKNNVTINNCQILFLNVIPGISIKTASIIMEKYTSINNLINQYNQIKEVGQRYEFLKEIQISPKRKLGKILSKKIYEYLCCINQS